MKRDPLDIATVPIPGNGRIGICRLPSWTGDFDAILRWKPAIVVSMTEAAEMAMPGAGDLPQRLSAAGIAWRHFPVADYGVPAEPLIWPSLAAELHARLDAGEAVLLHCRGGIGRSGMAALRLMVERGEEPEAGLLRLRAVRPGAVETEAQIGWAGAAHRRS